MRFTAEYTQEEVDWIRMLVSGTAEQGEIQKEKLKKSKITGKIFKSKLSEFESQIAKFTVMSEKLKLVEP